MVIDEHGRRIIHLDKVGPGPADLHPPKQLAPTDDGDVIDLRERR